MADGPGDYVLDVGEFRCIVCGRVSPEHPKDGLRECAECVEEWERADA